MFASAAAAGGGLAAAAGDDHDLLGLKGLTVFSEVSMSFIILNAFWCSSNHVHATPFCSRGLMPLVRYARSGMKELS